MTLNQAYDLISDALCRDIPTGDTRTPCDEPHIVSVHHRDEQTLVIGVADPADMSVTEFTITLT